MNRMLEKSSLSWTQFLDHLESTVAKGISMESIALSVNDRSITLTGSALALQELSAFMKALEDHPSFSNIVLKQHHARRRHEGKTSESVTAIEFKMSTVYGSSRGSSVRRKS